MIRIGVIGYGYWGPNIVRNLVSQKDVKVTTVCDVNPKALRKVKDLYPNIALTKDYKKAITSPEIDAVAIVTPISQHYPLAKMALENGRHIFIEKPFTATVKQAEELIKVAEKNKCQIMVDHTFIFTGAVQKIKEIINKNVLGELNYYDSTRVSLGLFQHDVNVIWDLAPHDFSIIDYIIKGKPVAVTAHGVDHLKRGQENIAYIIMYFENNFIAHINVNWLSPVKIRTTLIGGSKKMLLWDDLDTEKIKIYDKGVSVNNEDSIYKLKVDYRSGDMWSPHIDPTEALKKDLEYFIQCLRKGKTPVNDGHSGLRVVRMLEKTDQSLKNNGKLIKF